MRFLLKEKCGGHRERDEAGDYVDYKGGDIVESDRELDKIFARTNKFTRLSESPEAGPGLGSAQSPEFGTDVTSVAEKFPLEGKYKVFQKGAWFNVIEVESGERVNSKALRAKDVDAFVEQLAATLADSDEEESKEPASSESLSQDIADVVESAK